MNILFFSHRTPYPPHKGTQVRPYNMLAALAARGHKVHLLAFADENDSPMAQTELGRICASVELVHLNPLQAKINALAALPTKRSLSLAYFGSSRMHQAVRELVRLHGIQAMIAFSSTMAQYVPPDFRKHSIADMTDVDSAKWAHYATRNSFPRSWIYKIEGQRLKQYEYEIIRSFAYTTLVTHREIGLLTDLDEETRWTRVVALTNGVDLKQFRPDAFPSFAQDLLPPSEQKFLTDPNAPRIVFTGAMDYYPNVDAVCYFAQEVFPKIREQLPNAQFLIVGSGPTQPVLQLKTIPGVIVTGRVHDVRPYLAAATVCVIPLRIARGIQNKALEAMASGRAIIATPEVVAGIGNVRHEEHLLIAQKTDELTEAVLRIITDTDLRHRLEQQGREFVEREYDWKPLMERLAEMVESIARPAAQGRSRSLAAR
ncbi:MAG TPA: TIGR03087 family PEP-CTERM/XrtA system glycosyltransferase [Blastocatellia bacterium]|nr:TIGR03087 family PEP-CTERM/XrtA system glycosyltransferase [Blastocatellia bacterium]